MGSLGTTLRDNSVSYHEVATRTRCHSVYKWRHDPTLEVLQYPVQSNCYVVSVSSSGRTYTSRFRVTRTTVLTLKGDGGRRRNPRVSRVRLLHTRVRHSVYTGTVDVTPSSEEPVEGCTTVGGPCLLVFHVQ